MSDATRAGARMMCIPRDADDRRTSLADCRIALCIAAGTDPSDIDPAQGWDLSDRAYRAARDGWANIARKGSAYMLASWAAARDGWQWRRPDLAGDWPAWDGDDPETAVNVR